MSPNNTSVSAYDLLIYAIRTAKSISTEQKKAYIAKLERGALDKPLREELAELCKTEAGIRKRRAEQQQMLINEVKETMAENEPQAELAMADVVKEHDKITADIQSEFVNGCAAVERETNAAYEQVGKDEDTADIDSIRSFLKQEE